MSVAVAVPTLFDPFEERTLQRLAATAATAGTVATVAGHRTLDQLVVATWREVRAHGATACPICGAAMTRVGRTLECSGDVAAICGECRTEIS